MGDNGESLVAEEFTGKVISGILDRHRAVPPPDKLGNHIQPLLQSGTDHDLVGGTAHTA